MAWAYICNACNHEAGGHFLAEGGDLKAGPYQCQRCGCEISQDAPMTALTKRQYEAWKDPQ